MNLQLERWKPVVGYEGMYEVSDRGQVRGLDRVVWHKGGRSSEGQTLSIRGTVKRPWLGGPYPIIRLCRSGKKFTVPIHRLVAEAFLGPPPTPAHEVCHRNGINDDSRVDNLYWGTRKENVADTVRHGRHREGVLKAAKLKPEDIVGIRRLWNGTSMTAHAIAKQFGVSTGTISMAARGVTWK